MDFLGRLLEPPPTDAIQVTSSIHSDVLFVSQLNYHYSSLVNEFSWLQDAIEELEAIGALDEEEHLTWLGRKIAPITTHPRLAKALVYSAILGCVSPVVNIIAGLNSSREAWDVSTESKQQMRDSKRQCHPTSDHLALSNLMNRFSEQNGRHNVDQFCIEAGANPKALYFLKGIYVV